MLELDDLIGARACLLRQRADVADALAARWDHVLVDECQHFNAAKYEILKRLAAPHRNIVAVGDDEQSSFAWPGADLLVLVRFRDDFAIARPVVLDRNCRCSHQIFETARRLLAENPQLFDKQLKAERQSPHDVRAYAFPDEEAEATWLLEDLQADRAGSGLGWGDYAVLYRQHETGDYLDSRLVPARVPARPAHAHSPP